MVCQKAPKSAAFSLGAPGKNHPAAANVTEPFIWPHEKCAVSQQIAAFVRESRGAVQCGAIGAFSPAGRGMDHVVGGAASRIERAGPERRTMATSRIEPLAGKRPSPRIWPRKPSRHHAKMRPGLG